MPEDPRLVARSIEQHVAGRLRVARREKGLTLQEVARLLGVSHQQAQKYENGTVRIPVGRLALLCHYYGKDIRWFFAGLPGAMDRCPSTQAAE